MFEQKLEGDVGVDNAAIWEKRILEADTFSARALRHA